MDANVGVNVGDPLGVGLSYPMGGPGLGDFGEGSASMSAKDFE